ncbi:MAG: hypothetical protein JNK78_04060 [Planctomycetes bacterium]|nr:hypothetical protein [Planctomycetota bacterium]
MGPDDARPIEAALAKLTERFAADSHLRAEMQRARRQYFGEAVPGRPGADAKEQRFLEWFALERESEVLGAVPIDVPKFGRDAASLAGSTVGVLLVVAADDDGAEAEDLQDGESFDLVVPRASLRPGDLLVGRLFPTENGRWTPSAAAAVFRPGGGIGEAFRRDLARAGLERRLFQVEIEHLLLRRTDQAPSPTARPAAPLDTVPLEHLEARLESLLQKTDGRWSVTRVSQDLAASDRPGQVMGPLLDQLAFDTSVDLDATRRVLLEIWNAHHRDAADAAGGPVQLPPGETLGEQLVRTLDEGLRRHQDVEDLFAQLERMAGLDPGASDDEENPFDHDEDDADAESDGAGLTQGAAAGNLGPLVQEYLWETGREQEPAAGTLQLFVELQGNAAVPHTDLEAVTGADVMRLLLHCYLGAEPAARTAAVHAAVGEVQRFLEWAVQVHEIDLAHVMRESRGGIVEQVERLQAAGLALSTSVVGGKPRIVEIEEIGPNGFGVRDDDGGHHWIDAPAPTLGLLRAGDLLLGILDAVDRRARLRGLVVVLPADARAMME